MEYIQKIESAVTEDSLTLYWEKMLGDSGKKIKYKIHINDIEECETFKTHVMIEGLLPPCLNPLFRFDIIFSISRL